MTTLALALLAAGCDRQSSGQAQGAALERSFQGSRLPDFALGDTAGKQLRLQSLQGQPLLINLWATWCAPCVAELPALDRLAATGRVRVLTVSQDIGQPEKVAEFLKARGVTRLEPWLDPLNELAFHYKAEQLPASILYDAHGREVWRISGPREWDDPATRELLDEAH